MDGPAIGAVITVAVALWAVAGQHGTGSGWAVSAACGSVAALAGAATAGQYLLVAGVVEARFLVPGYALLTVSLAAAVPEFEFRGPAAVRAVALAGAGVLLLGFGTWQVAAAAAIGRKQQHSRAVISTVAHVLAIQSRGRPCFFASEVGFPEIAFASGCRGVRFDPRRSMVHLLDDPGSFPVYLLSRNDPPGRRTAAGGRYRAILAARRRGRLVDLDRAAFPRRCRALTRPTRSQPGPVRRICPVIAGFETLTPEASAGRFE